MKKKVIIVAIVAVFTTCSEDDVVKSDNPLQHNEIEEIKEFVLPDTLDIKKELAIAAYYEIHPKKACVIFAYKDTTRTIVNKYSYSNDSSFVVKEMVSLSYNEFKVKNEPTESYSIKPKSVVWTRISGNTAMDAEYDRIDVAK